MKSLKFLTKKILGFFGLKLKIYKIVKSSKNKGITPTFFSAGASKGVALLYLDVGADTLEFVMNSILSFRNFDSETDIIIFTDDVKKIEFYNSQNLNLNAICLDLCRDNINSYNYSEIGTQRFNFIEQMKWNIILRVFSLGYHKVIFSDFDIVYLDSVLNYINSMDYEFDFMIQSESQSVFPPVMCTGFMVIHKNKIPLLIELERLSSNFHDNGQILFNEYFREDFEMMQSIYILPESIFANGLNWKNLVDNDKIKGLSLIGQSVKPILFHANYLVGLNSKKQMLKQLGLWSFFEKRD
jgi:hypothetical protein